ncbi:MAG TPA: FecR domain-containing protein [Cryomorphaceae bacterium]|nr:FecR domain-containing protein [Cryomorphaceae bacterium]
MERESEHESALRRSLRADRLPFTLERDEAKARVMARIRSADAEGKVVEMRARPWILRLAAAVALLLIAGGALWFSAQEVVEASGHRPTTALLPDGSEIHLREGSTLDYNALLWKFRRKVSLEGEAFFSVKKGDTEFSVHTAGGTVRVLGTSFYVAAEEDKLDVLCKTGKVAVYGKTDIPTELGPGEGILSTAESTSLYVRTPETIGGWTEGVYRYENSPVKEVWEDVREAFGYEIEVDRMDQTYTGGFSAEDDLREVLDIICRPLGLEYTLDSDDKTIYINKN